MFTSLLALWKNSGILKWIVIALLGVSVFFYIQHLGATRQELKTIQQEQLKQQVTREKARKANENIKSSPDFIYNWLQQNGRFRD